MFNYWASIFQLQTEVVRRIAQICRNYLWGGTEECPKVLRISWQHTCFPKSKGSLGIKDFAAWNNAIIAKQVWAIANKKDVLWVKWMHGYYLKGKDWWDFIPGKDSSWTWKKICCIKASFKLGCTIPQRWDWQGNGKYSVSKGYLW